MIMKFLSVVKLFLEALNFEILFWNMGFIAVLDLKSIFSLVFKLTLLFAYRKKIK